MNGTGRNSREGFTIAELLVVIAVIGILASMLFPAVNGARRRAWNTKDSELCVQVATAWNALLLEIRRFPSEEFISYLGGKKSGDDMYFQMTPKACSALNWWKPTNPLPKYDLSNYKKWLANKKNTVSNTPLDESMTKWTDILYWPNDKVLERDLDQKKWGMIAHWLQLKINEDRERNSDSRNSYNKLTQDECAAGCVWVLLDTSGDGKITFSKNLGLGKAGQAADGAELELKKSAVAWVFSDEKKTRALTSW